MIENLRPIAPAVRQRRGVAAYLCLLGVQTVGAALALMHGVPIYRQLTGDFTNYQRQPGILWWAAAAVLLIQSAYWLRARLQPALPSGGHMVLGTVAFFVARLNFVFASSTFAVVFLVRYEQLNPTLPRILLVLLLLFSLFCYTLELERLAKALQTTGSETKNL